MENKRLFAGRSQRFGLFLSILLLAGACTRAGENSQNVALITEEEAALPASAGDLERGSTQACGPSDIRVESPRGGRTYPSPLSVQVRFTPSSGATIDLASIRIELLKLGLKIDLTPRARDYITAAGISMSKAEVPRGNHRVRISVADTSGKKCSEDVEFTVTRER